MRINPYRSRKERFGRGPKLALPKAEFEQRIRDHYRLCGRNFVPLLQPLGLWEAGSLEGSKLRWFQAAPIVFDL
jgi:hypothetical protein